MGRIKPLNEVKTKREVETMTEAAKEARRAYKREWNRKNPDKVRESQRRYWERKALQKDATGEEPPTIEEV